MSLLFWAWASVSPFLLVQQSSSARARGRQPGSPILSLKTETETKTGRAGMLTDCLSLSGAIAACSLGSAAVDDWATDSGRWARGVRGATR